MTYLDQLKTDAARNARAWLDTLARHYAAYRQLEGGDAEAVTVDGDEYTESFALLDRMQELPLSVEVRSGWHSPGAAGEPLEFRIVLTCGGPGCEVIGEIDGHGEAAAPRIYASEMGAGHFEVTPAGEECEALEWFCSLFSPGE